MPGVEEDAGGPELLEPRADLPEEAEEDEPADHRERRGHQGQRPGRTQELAGYRDKILALAPDSAYAEAAKRWKENPAAAAGTPMTCLSCHAPGRLAARRAALGEK